MNTNCLRGIRCPHCGYEDAFVIEIIGVLDGQKEPSKFRAEVTDDGFDNPVCEGDTEFVENGNTTCSHCSYTGKLEEFYEKDVKLFDDYPLEKVLDGKCPECGEEIPDDVANGEQCDNCGYVVCIDIDETEDE